MSRKGLRVQRFLLCKMRSLACWEEMLEQSCIHQKPPRFWECTASSDPCDWKLRQQKHEKTIRKTKPDERQHFSVEEFFFSQLMESPIWATGFFHSEVPSTTTLAAHPSWTMQHTNTNIMTKPANIFMDPFLSFSCIWVQQDVFGFKRAFKEASRGLGRSAKWVFLRTVKVECGTVESSAWDLRGI